MQGIVFDDFETAQGTGTTVSSGAAPGAWSPQPGTRQLIPSSSISGGFWEVSSIAGSVTYTYTNPQNFNSMTSIILNDITAEAGDIVIMQVSDGVNTSSSIMPLTTSSQIVFPIASFIGTANLNSITSLTLTASLIFGSSTVGELTSLAAIICVAKDTNILMADGSTVPIQNLIRDDIIAGSTDLSIKHSVARLIHMKCSPEFIVRTVKISKNSLNSLPNKDLIVTSGHKILWNDVLLRAKIFKKKKGVKYIKTTAKNILPKDQDDQYSLYNIQYDHNGFFIANGLTLESVPDDSKLYPLDHSLYFRKIN